MNNRYTLQTLGRGAKLLRNDGTTSTAITTITDVTAAGEVLWQLNYLFSEGLGDTSGAVLDAGRAGLQPAWLRRRALTAYDSAVAGAPAPLENRWWCEGVGSNLGAAMTGQHRQSIAAVRDELADLLTGLDEVLVIAKVGDSWGHKRLEIVVNDWLHGGLLADDDALRAIVRDGNADNAPDAGTTFDLIEHFGREIDAFDPGLTSHPDQIAFEFDPDRIRAWAAHHRPDLLA